MRRTLLTVIAGLLAAVLGVSWQAAGAATGEQRIVFRTVHLANPRRPPELYSVLPSGADRRLLARGADQPAWSPDRKRIAFAGGGILRKEGIWVMNADGTRKRRLTTMAGDGDPTWSPDGRRIAFRRDATTSFDLWVVAATGGKATPLLVTPRANELEPDWSPDGKRMAFQSSRGGSIQIWVMSLATKHARRLTRSRASFTPDWAPDGRRIAFSTGGRIAVVDADTRRIRILPSGSPRSADEPSWSPNGCWIAMRAQGGELRYVTRAAWGTNGEPDW